MLKWRTFIKTCFFFRRLWWKPNKLCKDKDVKDHSNIAKKNSPYITYCVEIWGNMQSNYRSNLILYYKKSNKNCKRSWLQWTNQHIIDKFICSQIQWSDFKITNLMYKLKIRCFQTVSRGCSKCERVIMN